MLGSVMDSEELQRRQEGVLAIERVLSLLPLLPLLSLLTPTTPTTPTTQDVREVGAMFQDLNRLVNEQQKDFDTIENNIMGKLRVRFWASCGLYE